MNPILHLSLPVEDVHEAARFYVDVLGCEPGRVRAGWCDVWFYSLQLTLQERPDEVPGARHAGVRHFGATLGVAELRALAERLGEWEWHRAEGLPGSRARARTPGRRAALTGRRTMRPHEPDPRNVDLI